MAYLIEAGAGQLTSTKLVIWEAPDGRFREFTGQCQCGDEFSHPTEEAPQVGQILFIEGEGKFYRVSAVEFLVHDCREGPAWSYDWVAKVTQLKLGRAEARVLKARALKISLEN
jgi:hypothetical protein